MAKSEWLFYQRSFGCHLFEIESDSDKQFMLRRTSTIEILMRGHHRLLCRLKVDEDFSARGHALRSPSTFDVHFCII